MAFLRCTPWLFLLAACDSSLPAAPDGAVPDMQGCVGGAACTTNPGAPCRAGVLTCAPGGLHPDCSDGVAAADGTTCPAGQCVGGQCRGPTMIAGSVDLSGMSVSSQRACAAEAPTWNVVALTSTQATLDSAPAGDCLAAGDEVMLINLQGTPTATDSVGNWELLGVASVQGTQVTFAAAKTRGYGEGGDGNIGTADGQQKVALVRVPHLGAVTIGVGATLSTAAWDGHKGGVLALRATGLTVNGTIDVGALGYRSGRWSDDTAACDSSVTTESGESIGGPARQTTSHQFGAPGGIGSGVAKFISSSPMNSGAGHATAGDPGVNGNGRTVGEPGAAYGAPDASRLTLGSGASGNLTCENGFPGPALKDVKQPLAGGIIALFVDQLDVGDAGSITASARVSSRDVSASAGYVYLKGSKLNLGSGRVTAVGALTTSGSSPKLPDVVKSSDGYIVTQAPTVTGTTTPVAHAL